MITLQQIATQSGVSPTTVSYVLNGRESAVGISARTRQRVLDTAQEMGYDGTQQLAARRMAGRKHGTRVLNRVFCLFFPPDFQKLPYFARVFDGVMEVLDARNYDLITTYSRSESQQRLPHSLMRGEVDGVLLFANRWHHDWLVPHLRSQTQFDDRPIVAMLHPFDDCDSVVADEEEGGYQLMRHLLELGHRRILHFYGTPHGNFHARARMVGYHHACLEYNLDAKNCLVPVDYIDKRPLRQTLKEMLAPVLKAHPDVTAIMARNDSEVSDLRDALAELGYSVPRTMSVVGFDDAVELRCEEDNNILTTLKLPLEEIGRQSAQLLIERVAGVAEHRTPHKIVLPVEFVARRSTAAPRSA